MITRPLDLQSHLRKPSGGINPVPLLDILIIALFFSFVGSNFVFAPGLTLNLPQGGDEMMAGLPNSVFLTMQSESVLLFEGQILNPESLQPVLAEHVGRRGETNLVVYVDRDVPVQALLAVSEIARKAGVARLQIASQPERAEPSGGFLPEVP